LANVQNRVCILNNLFLKPGFSQAILNLCKKQDCIGRFVNIYTQKPGRVKFYTSVQMCLLEFC
jgi:hypothetical protein